MTDLSFKFHNRSLLNGITIFPANDSFSLSLKNGSLFNLLNSLNDYDDEILHLKYLNSLARSNHFLSSFFVDFYRNYFDVNFKPSNLFLSLFCSPYHNQHSASDLRDIFDILLKEEYFQKFIKDFYMHILKLPSLYSSSFNFDSNDSIKFHEDSVFCDDAFYLKGDFVKDVYSFMNGNYMASLKYDLDALSSNLNELQDIAFHLFYLIDDLPDFDLNNSVFLDSFFNLLIKLRKRMDFNINSKNMLARNLEINIGLSKFYCYNQLFDFDTNSHLNIDLFEDESFILHFSPADVMAFSNTFFDDQFNKHIYFDFIKKNHVRFIFNNYFKNIDKIIDLTKIDSDFLFAYFDFLNGSPEHTFIIDNFNLLIDRHGENSFEFFWKGIYDHLKELPNFILSFDDFLGKRKFQIDTKSVSDGSFVDIRGEHLIHLKNYFYQFFTQDSNIDIINATLVNQNYPCSSFIDKIKNLPEFDIKNDEFVERFVNFIFYTRSTFNYAAHLHKSLNLNREFM